MNKKIKIIAVILLLAILGLMAVRYYIYNAGQRDIQSEETAFTVPAGTIIEEFKSNVNSANAKYLEKPVVVSGKVTSVTNNEAILDNAVNCNFQKIDASIQTGKTVAIKGRVIGYDDLLEELKLDNCNLNQ